MPNSNTTTLSLPSTSKRSLTLLVLLCDTPIDSVRYTYGNYHTIFSKLFENSLASIDSTIPIEKGGKEVSKTKEKHSLKIQSFDVVTLGEYPTKKQILSADGLLITGSASSAYMDLPWITTLVKFVSNLPSQSPKLKIIGICFGHQIIARAFGSTVEVNTIGGWEVGVRRIELTNIGKQVFGGEELAVHQMHRDHVPTLPIGFELLGSTPACGIHGMIKLAPRTTSSETESTKFDPTKIEIITLQGHPEFSPDIVTRIVNFRTQGGVFTPEAAEINKAFAQERDEGIRIGRVLLSILGV